MNEKCEQIQKDFGKYRDGLVDDDTRRAVDEHLNQCDDCRREYEFFAALDDAAADLPAPGVSDGDWIDVWNNVKGTLKLQKQRRKEKRRIFPLYTRIPYYIAAAAIIVVTVIVVNVMVLHKPLENPSLLQPQTPVTLSLATEDEMKVDNIEVESPDYTVVYYVGTDSRTPLISFVQTASDGGESNET